MKSERRLPREANPITEKQWAITKDNSHENQSHLLSLSNLSTAEEEASTLTAYEDGVKMAYEDGL